MRSILKDEMELFTLSKFEAMMVEQHEIVYSSLMIKKNYTKNTKAKSILLPEVGKVTLSY